ncbi:MaoC family protein [Geomicrobium sp. JCM 19037]|uniref:FAS1-like dehydratase domain-containing protein n=1 Tax=Geomicrobium sp. JCM 19037 TaxID=1460634 RepID=UPI00045F471E|nr:MaoC family dehydratase N-terminal domain-containing protein [Geomicrobium sp. JCM 19037]GAK02090.1 MaoC family protein [Geomicrobium sp. JCM 19037]
MSMTQGEVITFERTFTRAEVEQFTTLSMDTGNHHVHPDERGRLMLQGLLTATMPTKIGGDQNVIARTMRFHFKKPVYADEQIRCDVTIDKLTVKENGRTALLASFVCTNEQEESVLEGNFDGVIIK